MISMDSGSVNWGKIPVKALAIMVLPDPGVPNMWRL